MNGPGVHLDDMVWLFPGDICKMLTTSKLTATTDINGDLVYSETAGLYAAYFVVMGIRSCSSQPASNFDTM